jgi:hypothetical protein
MPSRADADGMDRRAEETEEAAAGLPATRTTPHDAGSVAARQAGDLRDMPDTLVRR